MASARLPRGPEDGKSKVAPDFDQYRPAFARTANDSAYRIAKLIAAECDLTRSQVHLMMEGRIDTLAFKLGKWMYRSQREGNPAALSQLYLLGKVFGLHWMVDADTLDLPDAELQARVGTLVKEFGEMVATVLQKCADGDVTETDAADFEKDYAEFETAARLVRRHIQLALHRAQEARRFQAQK